MSYLNFRTFDVVTCAIGGVLSVGILLAPYIERYVEHKPGMRSFVIRFSEVTAGLAGMAWGVTGIYLQSQVGVSGYSLLPYSAFWALNSTHDVLGGVCLGISITLVINPDWNEFLRARRGRRRRGA